MSSSTEAWPLSAWRRSRMLRSKRLRSGICPPTPDGPGGQPLALFESGAILVYIAGKTGQLMPAGDAARYETLQWLMFQMGGIGPMFGQLGFFNKFAGKDYEDKRPRDRYATESARLLGVLDERLAGRDWVMGADYSIADISLLGWVRNLIGF